MVQVEHLTHLTDKVLDFSGRAKSVKGMAGLTDYLSKKTRFLTTQERHNGTLYLTLYAEFVLEMTDVKGAESITHS